MMLCVCMYVCAYVHAYDVVITLLFMCVIFYGVDVINLSCDRQIRFPV